jgi:hypothetical protein
MNITCKIMAAATLSLFAGMANAATIVFDFEDANNGDSTYQSQGYTFDPVNLNSSQACADDGANPKHCFLEVTQGDPTTLTNDNENTFDLLAFHINFQGAGAQEDNVMALYGEGGTPSTEIEIGQIYDGSGAFSVYLASDLSQVTTALEQQTSYWIIINDDYFDGVAAFTWNASDGANNRVDCVFISDGGDNIGISDVGGCATSTPEVPLPAAGWLLVGGLGGLAFMRRRTARKA